jgi:hypothetical protein
MSVTEGRHGQQLGGLLARCGAQDPKPASLSVSSSISRRRSSSSTRRTIACSAECWELLRCIRALSRFEGVPSSGTTCEAHEGSTGRQILESSPRLERGPAIGVKLTCARPCRRLLCPCLLLSGPRLLRLLGAFARFRRVRFLAHAPTQRLQEVDAVDRRRPILRHDRLAGALLVDELDFSGSNDPAFWFTMCVARSSM